jgi:hypothetical protein
MKEILTSKTLAQLASESYQRKAEVDSSKQHVSAA